MQLVSDTTNAVLVDNGKLNFTGSTVDTKLGTVQLRAEFPNPGAKLLPGQFVKVRVLAGEQKRDPRAAAGDPAERAVAHGDDRRAATARPRPSP